MDKIVFVKLSPATAKGKKLKMEFFSLNKKKIKTSQFGSKSNKDYTIYNKEDGIKKANEERKKYDARHKVREDWTAPTTNGALAKWLLWNKPTLEASFQDYLKRFKFKKLP